MRHFAEKLTAFIAHKEEKHRIKQQVLEFQDQRDKKLVFRMLGDFCQAQKATYQKQFLADMQHKKVIFQRFCGVICYLIENNKYKHIALKHYAGLVRKKRAKIFFVNFSVFFSRTHIHPLTQFDFHFIRGSSFACSSQLQNSNPGSRPFLNSIGAINLPNTNSDNLIHYLYNLVLACMCACVHVNIIISSSKRSFSVSGATRRQINSAREKSSK